MRIGLAAIANLRPARSCRLPASAIRSNTLTADAPLYAGTGCSAAPAYFCRMRRWCFFSALLIFLHAPRPTPVTATLS